ncbi:hypothetical protein D3Z50_04780 [Clostridiaceae bacterium]|nr:hypothetical protein [Clostridiaceae bacterium]
MAVVDIIKDGETTFIFHDDYCKDTTPEEVEGAMKRIAQIALPHVRAALAGKQKEYIHKRELSTKVKQNMNSLKQT